MNTVTTITNATNGSITRITVIHHDPVNYRWLLAGVIAAALIAAALRKIFWSKNSN